MGSTKVQKRADYPGLHFQNGAQHSHSKNVITCYSILSLKVVTSERSIIFLSYHLTTFSCRNVIFTILGKPNVQCPFLRTYQTAKYGKDNYLNSKSKKWAIETLSATVRRPSFVSDRYMFHSSSTINYNWKVKLLALKLFLWLDINIMSHISCAFLSLSSNHVN